jgi:hypothetical protein
MQGIVGTYVRYRMEPALPGGHALGDLIKENRR